MLVAVVDVAVELHHDPSFHHDAHLADMGCIKVFGQFLLLGEDQEGGTCIMSEVQCAVQG